MKWGIGGLQEYRETPLPRDGGSADLMGGVLRAKGTDPELLGLREPAEGSTSFGSLDISQGVMAINL